MRFTPLQLCASALALLAILGTPGCRSVESRARLESSDAERMAWWREARFGMFVHWGLYAIPGGEWNGRTDYGEWIRAKAEIPLREYETLAGRFAPREFDAERWAEIAAQAGMGYMVVTTKHHDGFALFDSKATEFDVMSTPHARDVMTDVANACRKNGIVPCWYHSIMDWHHDDYLPRRGFETDRSSADADFDRYERYLSTQVSELLSNYGPIGVMWFDGEWESTWTTERGQRLYDLCRTLQPQVIVNNRVGAGRSGMSGISSKGEGSGDFGTPEQEVPRVKPVGIDWESCVTINENWGFNAKDKNFKSTRELLRLLVDTASKGGNLLLNVGPDADGRIPDEEVERLAAVGEWMRVNGEAIHKTSASPIDAPPYGRITYRTAGGITRLFVHILDWPADGRFVLEGLGNVVIAARLLADESRAVAIVSERGRSVFTIAGGAPDPDVSVVELKLRGEPIPYTAPSIEPESDLFFDETLVSVEPPSRALEARYTLDGSEPTLASAVARGPIAVAHSLVLRARAFHDDVPVGQVVTRSLVRTHLESARDVTGLQPGLVLTTSTGSGERLDVPWTSEANPTIVDRVTIPAAMRDREHVRYDFVGYLKIDADDVYGFRLESDDGSRLSIDGVTVCDNDGRHSTVAVAGAIALAAGWHAIEVKAFNATGASALNLRMGRGQQTTKAIAPERLAHRWIETGRSLAEEPAR